MQWVTSGKIIISEGEKFISMLFNQCKILGIIELSERINSLELQVKGIKSVQ